MVPTAPNEDENPNAALLESAKVGFDHLFSNDIVAAKRRFEGKDDPFHLLGSGVCAFLEAAMGMESGLMPEAVRCLTLSEAGSRKRQRDEIGGRGAVVGSRFPVGLEWDILVADTVVMLGLTHALGESYMGYLQCVYSLNNAHSKFTKLYKTVFPHGLDSYKTPATTPSPSPGPTRKSSSLTISSRPESSGSSISTATPPDTPATPNATTNSDAQSQSGFFARWMGGQTRSVPIPISFTGLGPRLVLPDTVDREVVEERPVDELIIAGTAFGYGLFNLVFSLLPKKVQSVVGLFGFKHDRKLALQALAVSAEMKDVHSVLAGLVLMTYHSIVLLLSGYQADEARIIKQFKAILDGIATRYPHGAMWILNKAKILRMSYDAEAAIQVLQEGLRPERPYSFVQADALLVFELAWTLLGQRRYQEAADTFIRITELNSWSHGTYYFLAAGCYISLGNLTRAQELLNVVPDVIIKKISGRELPTEVLIKKKLEFYKEKQRRRGGDERMYAEAIKISTAEEIGIFWNAHARVGKSMAQARIEELSALTPTLSRLAVSTSGPLSDRKPTDASDLSDSNTNTHPESPAPAFVDLDTTDELALRSLLLGVSHRRLGEYSLARACLKDAYARQSTITVSTWIPGVAMFEMAVLDLRVVEARERRATVEKVVVDGERGRASEKEKGTGKAGGWESTRKSEWERALVSASDKLDVVLSLGTSSVDLSARLDSRVGLLRNEIEIKREMLGIVG